MVVVDIILLLYIIFILDYTAVGAPVAVVSIFYFETKSTSIYPIVDVVAVDCVFFISK